MDFTIFTNIKNESFNSKTYMKRATLLLFALILFSCSNTKNNGYNYKVENKILKCFYQYYEEQGVDIKGLLDSIENVFVETHFFSDKTGKSYIDVFKYIYDSNDVYLQGRDVFGGVLKREIDLMDDIPPAIICFDSVLDIDFIDLANSKLSLLVGVADSIQQKGDISPRIVAGEYLKIFGAHDFENGYYRAFGLIMFANLIKMEEEERGLQRRLPPMAEEKDDAVDEQNMLQMEISAENKIFMNGKVVSLSEVRPLVKNFLLKTFDNEINLPIVEKQKVSSGVVRFLTDKGTTYQFYMSVQTEICSAYNEIRDQYSYQFFSLSYDDLDKDKKQIIDKIIPQRISETDAKM